MRTELLVTGCYRSGTTLLEKLLHAHPLSCVASQPFPALYAHVKGLFDETRGIRRRYPLSHRFLEADYSDGDFAAFLDRRKLTDSDIGAVFGQLEGHVEGHWTPEILGARAGIQPGVFIDVYRQLMGSVLALFPKAGVRVVGSKEILVEEYVPYLLGQGLHALIIVRDPRDMVASLNFRERDNATGRGRPVLYSMRVWRKSVATALAFEGHPRFRWLRYEDLVANPGTVMTGLGDWLGLPEFPADVLNGSLRDQRGGAWEGNSSFRDQAGVSRTSVGQFREILPQAVQALIEAVAAPEMELLGYSAAKPAATAVTHYRDPFTDLHARFPADYSADPRRVRDELERLDRLHARSVLSDEESRQWFVYPQAYRRLREAVAFGRR